MNIKKEEVLHLGALSMLRFSDEEFELVREHLDNIIIRFKQLNLVDTSDISPTAHILSTVNVFREDKSEGGWDRSLLLQNAPQSDGETFIVPQVLE